ncbi:heparanase-like isoform X1 [Acipenser ruthenus]|uniref:heparanase-like isoform X1 n=1 Tax=Acipenser ruthenus TaxID=7906 RepID=UPI002740E576|nr:heparanase-like isoform X1 [Acipenser ruthenus]
MLAVMTVLGLGLYLYSPIHAVFEKEQFAVVNADLIHVERTVSDAFLSVAVDTNLVTEERYINLLGSQKLRTLAKGLAPGYLRFGGTKADFMRFHTKEVGTRQQAFSRQFGIKPGVCDRRPISPETEEYLKSEWVLQEELILMEEHQNHCSKLNISGSTVDMLYNFANCSGFHLIFGLNALLRTKTNTWNSSNAEELLNYCQSKNYSMSWELGNEPNSFMKKSGIRIDGTQLGKDFVHLREILRRYKNFQDSGLYGPDVGQPRDHTENLLEGFLETGGKVIDACTWHHYYVNGRDTSLSDFLSPEVLDSLATKTQEIFQVVNETVPGKKVWLGETSSAYGGGAPGLSDTYVAGFMWLDKLGLSARLGIDVVIRQVLVGAGSYHLVDSNFDPLPDYWLSLLYKKLVGPKVLAATAFTHQGTESKLHRVYMHCTKSNSETSGTGAVTVFALNLSKKTSTIHLPPLLSDKTVVLYLLEPAGEDGLHSRSVQLNGKVLKMVDDTTLPVLTGIPLPVGSPLKLPALSFAFYVVKDANAPACR